MSDLHDGMLLATILVLTLMSAYFSSSETAMMALNRYRLRHLANEGHRGARKATLLLTRPDRLLGVILIGNNLVNNFAASVATLIAIRHVGADAGPAVATLILTVWMLIFAEVAPKTVAAERAEALAFPSSYLLQPLLNVARPLVIAINTVSNFVAAPLIARGRHASDHLSMDELRTVVNERSAIPQERQDMLLGILDLGNVTVDDVMVPRSEIQGIDISGTATEITGQITNSQHTRLPVYRDSIDDVLGILHLRRAGRFLQRDAFARSDVLVEAEEPYFIVQGTPLSAQLVHLRQQKQRIALVVDEYGDIQGLLTLEDILEEIVGEFTTDVASDVDEIHPQTDGTYIIEAKALLRDINRTLGWELPLQGPRTLNGLLLEHLEFIPDATMSLRIGSYLFEILQISDNVVRTVRARITDAANGDA